MHLRRAGRHRASTSAGPAKCAPADIQTTSDVEILNPDLYIATVNATGPPGLRHHRRAGPGLRRGRAQQAHGHDRCRSRSTRSSRRSGGCRSRSSRPASSRPRTSTSSTSRSRPTGRSRRATRSRRPATRSASSSSSSPRSPTSPAGLELGEVASPMSALRPRPRDRGARPLRACPQLPQAGAGRHHRPARSTAQQSDLLVDHELRLDVARRSHRDARRARPVAARED